MSGATDTGMPTRSLGAGGPDVSAVGLGCNNFGGRLDLERTVAVVDAALAAGITLFDTADVYGGKGGSERLLGEALEGSRDRVVLATKFGMDMDGAGGLPTDLPRGSREYTRRAIEASLERLRVDRLDLYQYHRPDGVTPVTETLSAMAELVDEGIVAHLGCSNFSASQLEESDAFARANGLPRFVSLQNEYNLLERGIEAEVGPICERLGVGILPFFPLASGLLTGKYARGESGPDGARLTGREEIGTDEEFDVVDGLAAFADSRGVELIDVAIGALAAQPTVASVISGATGPEQVEANAAAIRRFQPGPAELHEIDGIAPPGR